MKYRLLIISLMMGLIALYGSDKEETDTDLAAETSLTYVIDDEIEVGTEERASSYKVTFYQRNSSFSMYMSQNTYDVDNIKDYYYLRMMVSSKSPLKLGHRYEIPTEEADGLWESFATFECGQKESGYICKSGWVSINAMKIFANKAWCRISGEFELVLRSVDDENDEIKIVSNPFTMDFNYVEVLE